MDSFHHFILNYPSIFALIYLIIGIVYYFFMCWLVTDDTILEASTCLPVIIFWPIVVLVTFVVTVGFFVRGGLKFLAAPILKLGQRIHKNKKG